MDVTKYSSIPLHKSVADRLRTLAKIERHTLSDELDIILDLYAAQKSLEVAKVE